MHAQAAEQILFNFLILEKSRFPPKKFYNINYWTLFQGIEPLRRRSWLLRRYPLHKKQGQLAAGIPIFSEFHAQQMDVLCVPPKVCYSAYHSAVPGSNPIHTIYGFSIYSKMLFYICHCIVERPKQTKRARVCPIFKSMFAPLNKVLQWNVLECKLNVSPLIKICIQLFSLQ